MNDPNLLLLLPGLLCDGAVWDPLRPHLPEYDIVVPSWGMLDSLPVMASHALTLAGTRPFALAGHSMGGRIAMEVARQAPERVQRIALLDTGCTALAPSQAGERERAGRLRLLEIARTHGMRAMGTEWARGMVHPERLDSDVFEAVLQMIERSSPEAFAAQIAALLDRPDATPVLQGLTCPTMFIVGRQDTWSTVAQHEAMRALVPHSRLEIIEHCGHMSTMEQPQAMATVLRAWLAMPLM